MQKRNNHNLGSIMRGRAVDERKNAEKLRSVKRRVYMNAVSPDTEKIVYDRETQVVNGEVDFWGIKTAAAGKREEEEEEEQRVEVEDDVEDSDNDKEEKAKKSKKKVREEDTIKTEFGVVFCEKAREKFFAEKRGEEEKKQRKL